MRSPTSQDKEVKLGHSDIQNSNRGRGRGVQQRNQRGQEDWEGRGKSEKAKESQEGLGDAVLAAAACWEMWSLPRGAGNCSSLPPEIGVIDVNKVGCGVSEAFSKSL